VFFVESFYNFVIIIQVKPFFTSMSIIKFYTSLITPINFSYFFLCEIFFKLFCNDSSFYHRRMFKGTRDYRLLTTGKQIALFSCPHTQKGTSKKVKFKIGSCIHVCIMLKAA